MVRFFMRIFCLFPIKQNRILFESYKGKAYSCNPKYICEYLLKNYKDKYELVWVMNNPEQEDLPKQVRVIRKKNLLNYYYHLTAKVIVVNMTDDVFIPKRKKQIVINTWHAGGAYKKVGLSFENAHTKLTEWQDRIVREETSIYISSSALFTKFNIHEAYQYKGKILNCGLPRNDIFFDTDQFKSIYDKVRNQLNLKNKTVVLYAPTFRGDFGNSKGIPFEFPFVKVLKACQNQDKDAVILNRSHYSVKREWIEDSETVKDVTKYPDMQELLVCADILITDYSSSIWDFSLTGKPSILYVPDYIEYFEDRGMYTPMEKWPGFIAQSEDELIDLLEHIDKLKVAEKARGSLKYYGSYENGTACKKVTQLINEVCFNG